MNFSLAAISESLDVSNALQAIVILFSVALGGGGIAALVKARSDRKIGLAAQDTADDDALSDRYQDFIRIQTESLIEPLRVELAEVRAEVKSLKADLDESRKKYWVSIGYVRLLLTWINRHLPAGGEIPEVPPLPNGIADDV